MKTNNKKNISNVLEIVFFLIGIGVYSVILTSQVTRSQRELFSSIVQENSLLLLTIILFYLIAHQLPGWIGRSTRWIGLISLFGVFLKGYWIIKRSAYFQVYGFLPNVDATEYYENALRLLMNFPAQGTTIGRPFFSSFFSGLLWISQLDLHITLMILVAFVGISVFLLGESIRVHFGVIPSAMVVGFTFMFYANYLGAISSESLGLIFGCIGWVFLFETIKKPAKKYLWVSLFFLTTALVTRAGAFFVLPFIILAFLIIYKTKQEIIQYVIGSGIVVGIAFFVNSIILKIVSGNSSYLFPNSLYSIYGMAAGGRGWGYIKDARPDLMALAEPVRTQQIYQATIELIRNNPFVLLFNLLKQYYYFVMYSNTSVFSYLFTTIDWYNILLMVILYSACIISIVILIRKRYELKYLILLAVIIGILLSIPFVPPQDESDMRAFAVTVPIMALIPSLSINWLAMKVGLGLSKVMKIETPYKPVNKENKNLVLYNSLFGITIFSLTLIPTIFLRGNIAIKGISQVNCPDGSIPVIWNYLKSNSVNIINNDYPEGLNSIRERRMEGFMHDIFTAPKISMFQSLAVGLTLSEQVNYLEGQSGWLLAPTELLNSGDGIYTGCADYYLDSGQYLFNYYKVTSAQRIESE